MADEPQASPHAPPDQAKMPPSAAKAVAGGAGSGATDGDGGGGGKRRALDMQQLRAVADLFGVLSEPTRLRILQYLHDAPANVTQIVEALDIKQANASKQLGILHRAGVLGRRKQGNQVVYSVAMPLVLELCELICNRLAERASEQAAHLAGQPA